MFGLVAIHPLIPKITQKSNAPNNEKRAISNETALFISLIPQKKRELLQFINQLLIASDVTKITSFTFLGHFHRFLGGCNGLFFIAHFC